MDYFSRLVELYEEYKRFDKEKIPLCAAENYVSRFSMQGLITRYEGKYVSGYMRREIEKDFIGSDYLEKVFYIANDLAKELFRAEYNDFRTLTGMNTVALMLMSLVERDSTILITDPYAGGHGSLPKLCENYGINYKSIPFNHAAMQIDYDKLNDYLHNNRDISHLFFCQSDIIQPPDLKMISIPEHTITIYDATQTLGLIAGEVLPNPLESIDNIVMIGGTHKTFPSVTCGYVATNSDGIIDRVNRKISPDFLRNIQVNNIISVCLSMIEMLKIGREYSKNIVHIANALGQALTDRGIQVKRINEQSFTVTHQLFIEVDDGCVDAAYTRFRKYGITINKRNTPYITGFRLGVQEIARYGFEQHIDELAELIDYVLNNPEKEKEILTLKLHLAKLKKDKYLIDELLMELD